MENLLQQEPVRVGVIGLGIGANHLKSYIQQPGVSVVALADMDEQRLASLGGTYGVQDLYANYEELLARDDIDAVSICLPNFLHAPVAIAALERGKHVLCEKPLARNAQEAEEISRAAVKANRVLQVVFNKRSSHDVATLKKHIDDGGLGQIYYAKASWMRRQGFPRAWFGSKEKAGGGPLVDLGIHVLEMALHLLGNPDVLTVSASTYAHFAQQKNFDVEDLATAFLRCSNGATLLLEASYATHSNVEDEYGVTLYGTDGGAEFHVKNYGIYNTLRFFHNVGDEPVDSASRVVGTDGFLAATHEFIAAIRQGNWSAHTGQRGLHIARLIDACYLSSQQGREIVLAELV